MVEIAACLIALAVILAPLCVAGAAIERIEKSLPECESDRQ